MSRTGTIYLAIASLVVGSIALVSLSWAYGPTTAPATMGATRRLTFSEPGLYHIYCSMHTRMVGSAGQWRVVVPRDKQAWGYLEHNAMEAWILVVQGQAL